MVDLPFFVLQLADRWIRFVGDGSAALLGGRVWSSEMQDREIGFFYIFNHFAKIYDGFKFLQF
jgi:hypothetical protein